MAGVTLSDDPGFDFALRCLLSGVAYDMAEPGEVLAMAERIVPADVDSWFDTLSAQADRCATAAAAAQHGGHPRSVATASLREANYRYAAFYYVLGTRHPERHHDAWVAHRTALTRALDHFPTPVQHLRVDSAEGAVPAWLFTPAGPAPHAGRPLVVVHNLLTAPLSDTLMTGVVDAVERGWAAVAFEGPGQGATWFENGIGPTDDWAGVAEQVLDRVLAEPGFDASRVVAMGIGDGGYLAAQAAAADPRTAALVCDPGVIRPVAAALGQLPDDLRALWEAEGAQDPASFDRAVTTRTADDAETAFVVAKLTEQWPTASLADVLRCLGSWNLGPHIADIRCPTFIADPDEATSFPGQSAELASLLADRAELVPFSSEEGAGLDCEIGAPRLRNQRVFDWLEDRLGPVEPISTQSTTEKGPHE